MGELLYAEGTEVFELVNCDTIRASGARVGATPDGLGDDVWGEKRGRPVQRAHLIEAPLYMTCLGIGGGGGGECGELSVEGSGYILVAGERFVVEGDRSNIRACLQ